MNKDNLLFTIIIGLIIGGLLYLYYFRPNNISFLEQNDHKDIHQCLTKFNSNKIYEFPNLLTNEECDKIIELSRNKVTRSSVIGTDGNELSDVRTSKNTFLDKSVDPLMSQIDDKIKNIIGISSDKYESLQVVNYTPGTFYKAHWDACDPNKDPRCINDHKKGGLRFATFIIYLNDDMEGGETEFPLLNLKIKPQKGKGILFFNLNDDLLGRRELSKHAGLPPTKGEKWMCNKWIRMNQHT